MSKRIVSLFCIAVMLFSFYSFMIPVRAEETIGEIIEGGEIPLRLHYNEEAPYGNEDTYKWPTNIADDGWEKWSLPIGNGYFGANVFGRTETERIQITEKNLANPYYRYDEDGTRYSLGGLNNFSETYIDFGHINSSVTDYSRWLDLETAISGVSYAYNGVTYTREYFTSYPDKVLVIRLDASEEGALDFTLRPTVPWMQDYAAFVGDGASKTGSVTSKVENGIGEIELSGKMGYYDIDFLGLYKVYTNGGTVTAGTSEYTYTDTANASHTVENGTITVNGATSAYIVVTLGTDYELTEEVFTSSDENKPTFKTTLADTRAKVEGDMNAISAKLSGKSFDDGYNLLKTAHVADYSELFSRVSLELGDLEDAALTTDELLKKYQNGEYSQYLEVLYYQYGRYLLIASSREGALPANLQGTWNRYNFAPWSSGYWHNVNVQMNYWPAFNSNLIETFVSYVDYCNAYMPAAEANASSVIAQYNASKAGTDGGDGWCIGVGAFPNEVAKDRSAGNLGFTTQLFWEYYEFTKDPAVLENVYDVLISAARFITKTVELTDEGYYLVSYCDSPEMYVDGVWYYTKGTTYAQTFAYVNNYNALEAAKKLGIDFSDESHADYAILQRVLEQLDKYDPINVGLSGQIKEFREEDYYCSIGDDPQHRHTSQLVGLYPGNIINSTTPAWLDAAIVTLTERGDKSTGWGIAFRLNMWARTKNGERSYDLLNQLLSTSTATNLWDLHPPFQIDGNFGGTTGIAEMLLQSHEGYIAPLAAIPEKWQNGSYTGLVARGNFEVSAKWQNGVATVFNVTSKAGERVSVSYSGIASAKVFTASGKKVSFEITGKDIISFDTEKGETYIISGFTVPVKVNDVYEISAERIGLGPIEISWSKTAGVSGYNLYVAADHAPNYTLITSTSSNSYVYTPGEENLNSRFTFKVKAVDEAGNESNGAICYLNPIDTEAHMEDYEANVFASGELQVVVKATDNTKTYKLWRLAEESDEYELVHESKYPILICENYRETDKYALSLVSTLLETESEKHEIIKFRSELSSMENGSSEWVSNILKGLTMVPNPDAPTNIYSSSYGYDKLTDGGFMIQPDGSTNKHKSRYSAKSATDVLDATVRLGNTYLINEVRLYDYTGLGGTYAGDNIVIYVLSDNAWLEAARLDGKSAVLAAKKTDAAEELTYVSLNLGYVAADSIRVVCSNDTSTKAITLYEITASGISLEERKTNVENVFEGKTFTGNLDPYSSSYGYEKLTDGNYELFKGRFALPDVGNQTLVLECDLGEIYELCDFKIYDLCDGNTPRIKSFTIEVYYSGEWIKIVNSSSMPNKDKRAADVNGAASTFDLGGVKAEKIRITCQNGSDAKGVSIYEILCSGKKKDDASGGNVLAGKTFTGSTPVVSEQYGYEKLTDGDYNTNTGKFVLQKNADNIAVIECELGALYELYELKLYDWCNQGVPRIDTFDVELYYAGAWVKVLDAVKVPVWNDRVYESIGRASVYNLGGAKGEKIRFTFVDKSGAGISIYEILCDGVKCISESASTNAFSEVKNVSVMNTEAYTTNPLTNAFDGNFSTRYATKDSNPSYILEIELERVKKLYTLNIYDFRNPTDLIDGKTATRSDKTYIELYINGEWIRIIDNVSITVDQPYTSFYLFGIAASKIRIGFNNTREFDDGSQPAASIYEITCSTDADIADRKPMLEAYKKLDCVDYATAEHGEKMAKYISYLSDFELDIDTVTARSIEMNDYYETVKKDLISNISFTPKTSITLSSELIYNVYIPIESTLKSFTLDGITYDNLATLKNIVTLSDGKQYYHFEIELPASEAARNIILKAVITVDGNDYNGTWTMSIPKYAAQVINDGNAVEVQLVKDVLAYVRAAYAYFDETNAEAMAKIDALLGENYDANNTPAFNGSADVPTIGLNAVAFVLNATPAIRFYISDVNAKYEFYANETKLATKQGSDENGAYLEMDVYAYAMCKTITYKINGVESGSYHINSYYKFVTTDEEYKNNVELIKLVERFAKYCESAAAYRNYVLSQNSEN